MPESNETETPLEVVEDMPEVWNFPVSPMLVTVHYTGLNNGMPEQGIRTLTMQGPRIKNPEELQEVIDVAATTLFSEVKLEKLQLAVINIQRFPL